MFKSNGKPVLLLGGTGSLGKALTSHILKKYHKVKRLVIISRNEQKQFEMAPEYPLNKYSRIRLFVDDIRDSSRVNRALNILKRKAVC